MVSLKQSCQPETKVQKMHIARVSECARCGAGRLNFKPNQDGDLVCLRCGWVKYVGPVEIAPVSERDNVNSSLYHLIFYAGGNPIYRDRTIPATVVNGRPQFLMRCPFCGQDVTVGMIALKVRNARRWRVECRKHHVIFVAPDADGVPETWWI